MSCGYMNMMYGNIYEGRYENGADRAVGNGTLMVLDPKNMKLVLPAEADTVSKFYIAEETTIYDGVEAFNVTVMSLDKHYYFVENLYETGTNLVYDMAEYEVPVGKKLRAHEVLPGEKFYVSKPKNTTLKAGNMAGVNTDGALA